MDSLFQDVQFLKGVGPKRSRYLARLGISTLFDLLWHAPRDYFDQTLVKPIDRLLVTEKANIVGRVAAVEKRTTRSGRGIFKALIQDQSGETVAVWFNQSFLAGTIKPGMNIFLSGRLGIYAGRQEFQVSEYEILDEENPSIRLLPIYPLSEGLSQKAMRGIVNHALRHGVQTYPEILSEDIRKKYGFCDIAFAFVNMHFPSNQESCARARRRLAFEELFLFHHHLWQRRLSDSKCGIRHAKNSRLVGMVKERLPFELTFAQERVLKKIFTAMESSASMNLLLQGDVGSGKTVVAALAMTKAADGGYQSVIMAPTEILAQQHYQALIRLLEPAGINIACLTGAAAKDERRQILEKAACGTCNILVGTHSLLQDDIIFQKLGLVVIDEQHRFGVKQRALLGGKGENADLLVMTATPIPRTLALTLYGDLDLAVIDALPPGRKPVKTRLISQEKRNEVYRFLRHKLSYDGKCQAYIICPLVEETEAQDLRAAETLYEELKAGIFHDAAVGLVHGRIKSREKDRVMQGFKKGDIRVLVATSVVEVGVDVPQATLMVVEHADRFGLSQLHQLRGRVGRGDKQSFCFLLADPRTDEAWMRLKAMERTNDGFLLAREDLKIRGPGEFWGFKQHGLNQFKVANLLTDQELIEISLNVVRSLKEPIKGLETYFNKKFLPAREISMN